MRNSLFVLMYRVFHIVKDIFKEQMHAVTLEKIHHIVEEKLKKKSSRFQKINVNIFNFAFFHMKK